MYFIQVRNAMTCVPNKHRAHLLREPILIMLVLCLLVILYDKCEHIILTAQGTPH